MNKARMRKAREMMEGEVRPEMYWLIQGPEKDKGFYSQKRLKCIQLIKHKYGTPDKTINTGFICGNRKGFPEQHVS